VKVRADNETKEIHENCGRDGDWSYRRGEFPGYEKPLKRGRGL